MAINVFILWEAQCQNQRLSRPTREQILESARMMVPVLRERALKAERDRLIPVDTHRAFQEAGFYKLFQPGRYGGYEMPIGMMVEVASELGRGICGLPVNVRVCPPSALVRQIGWVEEGRISGSS